MYKPRYIQYVRWRGFGVKNKNKFDDLLYKHIIKLCEASLKSKTQ